MARIKKKKNKKQQSRDRSTLKIKENEKSLFISCHEMRFSEAIFFLLVVPMFLFIFLFCSLLCFNSISKRSSRHDKRSEIIFLYNFFFFCLTCAMRLVLLRQMIGCALLPWVSWLSDIKLILILHLQLCVYFFSGGLLSHFAPIGLCYMSFLFHRCGWWWPEHVGWWTMRICIKINWSLTLFAIHRFAFLFHHHTTPFCTCILWIW